MSVITTTQAAEYHISSSNEEIVRCTANFKPSIWGDRFADFEVDDAIIESMQNQVEELKVAVRREVFVNATNGSSHQLKLIDAVQRLGVAYHFEAEIGQALEHTYATYHENHSDDDDLYNAALRFRLLRRHGYNVSCDIFYKFKDANGNFEESLGVDISGMLMFYEAAHLSTHGEKLLDEALAFTTTQLKSAIALAGKNSLQPLLKAQITEALQRPLLKTIERLGARRYISIYQEEALHNEDLLKLAKLDFNLVQCSHKKELSDIIRWYKDMEFAKRMPFARDRIVELFFWIVGISHEPQYVFGRSVLTKLTHLLTVMDDMYDAFGTYEELVVLTEAIDRSDESQLGDRMQPFYQIFLDVLNEVEHELINQGRSYRAYYAREIMKRQSRVYFAEAKWLHEAFTPNMDEYMSVATTSIGNNVLAVGSLLGMGDNITSNTFEWMAEVPRILHASNIMFRLMDDIAGHKFEKERAHVVSSIDCYMKQHGVSEKETVDVFNKRIVDSWKDINEEFLKIPVGIPVAVLDRVLNMSRVVDLLYKKKDAFTHGGKLMKDSVTTLFIDPVPL